MPGISAVSPPISAQPACRQPVGDAGDHALGRCHVELAAGKVVEEEQRLRALHHQIVDAHGDEIDADGRMPAGIDRDLELGADPVGRRDQHGIAVAGAFEVEQGAETAEIGVGARPAAWPWRAA